MAKPLSPGTDDERRARRRANVKLTLMEEALIAFERHLRSTGGRLVPIPPPPQRTNIVPRRKVR